MRSCAFMLNLLNGDGPYGEFSKIFDREDFGYREIRVERPLRLSFQVTPRAIGTP